MKNLLRTLAAMKADKLKLSKRKDRANRISEQLKTNKNNRSEALKSEDYSWMERTR